MAEEVNSRHAAAGKSEALALARQAERLFATRGTKVLELDLRGKPKDADILALMLGPTGNLRAPTFRVGRTLYVGFPKEGFPGLV